MKRIRTYLMLLLCVLMAACSDDTLFEEGADVADGPGVLTLRAQLPELSFEPATRGFVEMPTPEYIRNVLKLHLFVFDGNGVMLQYIRPSQVDILNVDEVNKITTFKVRGLYSSGQPRILHFIASPIADFTDETRVMGADNIVAMASENTSMANLILGAGGLDDDAYWSRKVMPDGLTDESVIDLRLLRNFAKLTVNCPDSERFRFLGYSVVNRPGIGTVAPFQFRDHFFAEFFNDAKEPISYDDIRATGYVGVNPAGVDDHLINTTAEEVKRDLDINRKEPVYFYERSQSGYLSGTVSDNLTYIVVKGEYDGHVYYYRIDIGADSMGKFDFFDLLRNFMYTLNITEVGGPGSETVEEAMKAPAHNNLSTSVVTKDLFSIGYSGQKIEVSATTAIITNGNPYDLRFRYTIPTSSGDRQGDPDKLFVYLPSESDVNLETDCSGATGGKPMPHLQGSVIESATLKGPDAGGWYTLTIDPANAPSAGYLSQNIRIYYRDTDGLGRTVTFQRRNPWKVDGQSVRHDARPYTSGMTLPAQSAVTGFAVKNPVNIYYRLPAGLGKSLFPLILDFESDKQNIYAHPEGPLTVKPLERSGFSGGTSNRVIGYERRVEWGEYEAYASTGMWLVNPFLYHTRSDADVAFATGRIDRTDNGSEGRTHNNGQSLYAVRISNPEGFLTAVVDNIERREYREIGALAIGWNRNAYNGTPTRPTSNTSPFTLANARFLFTYQLPQNLRRSDFDAAGNMTFTITSSRAILNYDGVSRPFGMTLSGKNTVTQTVTWDEYQANRNVSIPLRLDAGTNSFTMTVSEASGLLSSVSGTVQRVAIGSPTLNWDRTAYGTNYTKPNDNTNPLRSTNATFSFYYTLPDGLEESMFGADGTLDFTITCSRDILNYDANSNRPYSMEISGREITQKVTWAQYQANKTIIVPLRLDYGTNSFTMTVENTDGLFTKATSGNISRSRR